MTAGTVVFHSLLTYGAILPSAAAREVAAEVGSGTLHALLAIGIVKWTILSHVLTRLALRLSPDGAPGGFALAGADRPLGSILATGVVTGILATGVLYGLGWAWYALGLVETPIWIELTGAGFDARLGILGGLRNLFGEEILTRLGVQTLVLHHLRGRRLGPLAAVVISSLFFEIWHADLPRLLFLNFSVSIVLAVAFDRRGYETAAIGHCTADWLGVALLPGLLA